MHSIRRGSIASYCLAAAIAAGLSAFATWHGGKLATPSLAQTAPPGVREILTQPLADLPGREVRMTLLERAPGSSSPVHRHPGHHVFGYVIEGSYEFAINGQRPRLLSAGDTFYEPPGAVHSTSRNPSADQRLKIIVFMVAEQKNPSTVVEKN